MQSPRARMRTRYCCLAVALVPVAEAHMHACVADGTTSELQAVECGLGFALPALIPTPKSLEAFEAELAILPAPPLTPLPPRPACCDPEGDSGDAAVDDAGSDPAARRMLSLPSGVSDDAAALSGAASLASNPSRRSSRRGSRRARSFRTAASGVPQEAAVERATAPAAAVPGRPYESAPFPEEPGHRPLPPRTIRAAPEAWRALQRVPREPTRVPEVLAACVQMLQAVLAHPHTAAWSQAELWPLKSTTE